MRGLRVRPEEGQATRLRTAFLPNTRLRLFFRKSVALLHPLLPNRNTCVYEIICRCITKFKSTCNLVAGVVNHVTWNVPLVGGLALCAHHYRPSKARWPSVSSPSSTASWWRRLLLPRRAWAASSSRSRPCRRCVGRPYQNIDQSARHQSSAHLSLSVHHRLTLFSLTSIASAD